MKKVAFVPIVLITILLIVGILQIIWPQLNVLNDIIKIGLSWPVLLIVFLSSLVILFEEPIRKFLEEFRDIEAKGIKISRQQDKENNIDLIPPKAVNDLLLQRDYDWQQLLETERQVAAASIENINASAKEYIDQILYESLNWRIKYAEIRLVRKTKIILDMISNAGPFSIDTFENIFQEIEPDKVERNAVMNALFELEFIEIYDASLQVTPHGRVYIAYLKNIGQLEEKDT
jgi:hypothetical protein